MIKMMKVGAMLHDKSLGTSNVRAKFATRSYSIAVSGVHDSADVRDVGASYACCGVALLGAQDLTDARGTRARQTNGEFGVSCAAAMRAYERTADDCAVRQRTGACVRPCMRVCNCTKHVCAHASHSSRVYDERQSVLAKLARVVCDVYLRQRVR